MKDKLPEVVRIGKVSAIYPERCTAEVTFEDRGNIVTKELFIIVPYTLKDRAYYMPAVQERVLCVFDPGATPIGYILGSFFCDTRIPPFKDENKTYINFEDETLVEYDKKLHTLTVKIPEDGETSINIETASHINIVCNKDVNVTANQNINVTAQDDIKITAKGNLDMKSSGAMTLESDAMLKLDAPQIRWNDKYPG